MLKNMRIRSKFLLLVVFLGIGMIFLFFLSRATLMDTAIGGKAYDSIILAKDLTADILPPPLYVVETFMDIQGAVYASDPKTLESTIKGIDQKKGDFEKSRAQWTAKLPAGTMKTLLTDELCATAVKIYDIFGKELAAALRSGDKAKAVQILDEQIRPEFAKHRAAVEKLVTLLDEFGKAAESGGVAEVNSGMRILMIGFAAVIVFVMTFLALLLRDFSRSFAVCLGFARDVAAGRLDASIDVSRSDDFGELEVSLRSMLDALKESIKTADHKTDVAKAEMEKARAAMLETEEAKKQADRARAEGMLSAAHQLQSVAEVIASSSEQLNAQIDLSGRGAELEANRVATTATAMEEMNATVLEVAKNASQAAETAETAKHKAEDGATVVSLVVKGIAEVQGQALELKSDMTALGKQAEGIGQVMNVISDIADQTNLLALNAAIEAARAGDAGRGFAVVADEVRKLAEKTMSATKEVGEAITGIQAGTRKNIENVEQAVKKIDVATGYANQSGESLNEIVSLVDLTTDQVRSIATASDQQSAASEEINRSIEDINKIASETSEAMAKSMQAVADLATQAQVLKDLIVRMEQEGGESPRALPSGRAATRA